VCVANPCLSDATAAGQTFLQYTFGTAKKAGFNTLRFFALVIKWPPCTHCPLHLCCAVLWLAAAAEESNMVHCSWLATDCGRSSVSTEQCALSLQGDNDDNRNAANLTQFALQPEPGVYNETIFRAIDRVLAAADTSGLKVMLVHEPQGSSPTCKHRRVLSNGFCMHG
jgi:hypothetical protein